MQRISKIVQQKGPVKTSQLKELKENARVTQQKGRRLPFQLQNQVDVKMV